MKFSIAAAFTGLVALVSASPQYRPGVNVGFNYGGGYAPPATTTTKAASAAFATPSASKSPSASATPICLTSTTAGDLVTKFASLITNYTDSVADALLSDNFTDTSNSINMLGGYPLDGYTFASKAAFKAGQGSQPKIPFNVLSIDTITCTNVTFRWNTNVVPGGLLVKGINSFVAVNKNNSAAGWQINTMYSEFNAWAWAKNVGLA